MINMKSVSTGRSYHMTARAEAAEQTERNILAAAVALWREHSPEQITLAMIAERSGVTVQTVIRRFGSKEGVIAACIERDAAGLHAERQKMPAGDVASQVLLEIVVLADDTDFPGSTTMASTMAPSQAWHPSIGPGARRSMSALRKLSTMGFERGLLNETVLGARKRCRREIRFSRRPVTRLWREGEIKDA